MDLYGEAQMDMSERLVIRKAELKDAKICLNFHQDIYKYHQENIDVPLENQDNLLERIKDDFRNNRSDVFLAVKQTAHTKDYVGFIEIRIEREKRTCYISALWTTPEARGEGVASRLMNIVSIYAREKGCNTISLDVFDFNEEAKNLYTKLGYKQISHNGMKSTLTKKL